MSHRCPCLLASLTAACWIGCLPPMAGSDAAGQDATGVSRDAGVNRDANASRDASASSLIPCAKSATGDPIGRPCTGVQDCVDLSAATCTTLHFEPDAISLMEGSTRRMALAASSANLE